MSTLSASPVCFPARAARLASRTCPYTSGLPCMMHLVPGVILMGMHPGFRNRAQSPSGRPQEGHKPRGQLRTTMTLKVRGFPNPAPECVCDVISVGGHNPHRGKSVPVS